MHTLSISTHHCRDLNDAYKDFNFTGVDRVVV